MFRNKVVLVTGGTKGIGKSMVMGFLKMNATVITLYSKDTSAINEIKKIISKEEAARFIVYKGSIADSLFLDKVFGEIEQKFGYLDVLVNNAGISKDSLFLEMSDDDWNAVIDINIKGTINVSLLALSIMKKGSRVINISSISGMFGRAGQLNYACSKGAIIGATKLLAKKYATQHININAVLPGLINTDMVVEMPSEKINEVVSATHIKRMGEAEEVAQVVIFLASPQSAYLSGTCISVDGGFLK